MITKIERDLPNLSWEEIGLEQFEYRVLTEAKRRLHHFISPLPDEEDHLSWLALLRHHGVPTRLIDVTRSLYIACYFAVRDTKPDVDAAVWIFSRGRINAGFDDWIWDTLRQMKRDNDDTWLRKSPFTVGEYGEYYWPLSKRANREGRTITVDSLRHPDLADLDLLDFSATLEAAMLGYIEKPGVAVVEPAWLSRRLDVQQGTFIIPFNVRKSFETNLFSFLQLPEEES